MKSKEIGILELTLLLPFTIWDKKMFFGPFDRFLFTGLFEGVKMKANQRR